MQETQSQKERARERERERFERDCIHVKETESQKGERGQGRHGTAHVSGGMRLVFSSESKVF